jgi:hypothetical protein
MSQVTPKNFKTELVSADQLKVGDSIFLEGHARTVGRHSVKDGFCGWNVEGFRVSKIQRFITNSAGCLISCCHD